MTLQSLPDEVHLLILSHLTHTQSTCLGLTCKKFYTIHYSLHGKVGIREDSLVSLLLSWIPPTLAWDDTLCEERFMERQKLKRVKRNFKRLWGQSTWAEPSPQIERILGEEVAWMLEGMRLRTREIAIRDMVLRARADVKEEDRAKRIMEEERERRARDLREEKAKHEREMRERCQRGVRGEENERHNIKVRERNEATGERTEERS